MRAVVKYAEGEGSIEIQEVTEPKVGDDEVKIKVKAVGFCGSDLHIYKGDIRIPMRIRFTIGHEFSGVVTKMRTA